MRPAPPTPPPPEPAADAPKMPAREVQLWLLRALGSEPRLVQEVQSAAEAAGIPPNVLKRASQSLPIVRRPRELRGPWTWRLPASDEMVPVRYHCPFGDCSVRREGWMAFERSACLFTVGLLDYRVKGRLLRVRPSGGEDELLPPHVDLEED